MTITPGKHSARITDYGLSKTKGEKLQVFINLAVYLGEDATGPVETPMTWFGSLNEGKALDITTKTLVACGAKTPNLALMNKGAAGGFLDQASELTATVEEEIYNGTARMKVRWLNGPSTGVERADDADVMRDEAVAAASMALGTMLAEMFPRGRTAPKASASSRL